MGGGDFLSAAEKDEMIAAGTAFGISGVAVKESNFGGEEVVYTIAVPGSVDLDGRLLTFKVDEKGVRSREASKISAAVEAAEDGVVEPFYLVTIPGKKGFRPGRGLSTDAPVSDPDDTSDIPF